MPCQIVDIIGYAICNSISILFEEQPDILDFTSETSETEWNLSHHLAFVIQRFFPWLVQDIELKKNNYGGKRPDIVLHKRDTNKVNYIIIEIKHRGNDISEDIRKIKKNWMAGLKYEFGCAVKINQDKSFEVTVIHKDKESIFLDSKVEVINPDDFLSFIEFLDKKQYIDMDSLNELVQKSYTVNQK